MGLCVGDWMKLRIGQLVIEKGGRHEARVEAIFNSSKVKVKFLDSGWISYYALDELERVPYLQLIKG